MSTEVSMTRDGTIVWNQQELAGGLMTTSPGFTDADFPFAPEELIEGFSEIYQRGDFSGAECIGAGGYGRVYRAGGYAIKFVTDSYTESRMWVNADSQKILDQTRLAVALRRGIASQRRPQIAAPEHFMCWESPLRATSGLHRVKRDQIQVMQAITPDENAPRNISGLKLTSIRRHAAHSFERAGIKQREVYWGDLGRNIIMSGGKPHVIDQMPAGRGGLIF